MIKIYDAADGPLRVLFVMATEAEYGPALRALITPVITGVGPVEAAVQSAKALHENPADLVINMGSAGSRTLQQAEVFQVSHVSYRDMDASPLGFAKGITPFLNLPAELTIPQRLPGLPSARIATGASIVNGAAYDAIDADMVDMESYAVLRACIIQGVSMICLRGVSDGVEEIKRFSDWTFYLAEIDAQLAAIVRGLPDAFAALPKAYWIAQFRN
jgi:adenosylhomocysteine nucleosidase